MTPTDQLPEDGVVNGKKDKNEKLPGTHKDSGWRARKLGELQGLKSPSPAQRLLIEISAQTKISPNDARKLDTLFRAELAKEKLNEIENRALRLARSTSADREKTARQIRNKRLIDHGLLVELAGLHERSEAELYGMLTSAAKASAENWGGWALKGADRIASRDADRQKSRVAKV